MKLGTKILKKGKETSPSPQKKDLGKPFLYCLQENSRKDVQIMSWVWVKGLHLAMEGNVGAAPKSPEKPKMCLDFYYQVRGRRRRLKLVDLTQNLLGIWWWHLNSWGDVPFYDLTLGKPPALPTSKLRKDTDVPTQPLCNCPNSAPTRLKPRRTFSGVLWEERKWGDLGSALVTSQSPSALVSQLVKSGPWGPQLDFLPPSPHMFSFLHNQLLFRLEKGRTPLI